MKAVIEVSLQFFNPKFLNLPVDFTPKWVAVSCIVIRLCHDPWHDNAEQPNHGPGMMLAPARLPLANDDCMAR